MPDLLFLERTRKGDYSGKELNSKNEVFFSIKSHLQKLLNIKLGSIPIDEKLGVQNFAHIDNKIQKNESQQLIVAIKKLIQSYEKRMKNISIEFETKKSKPIFKIQSQVSFREQEYRLSMQFAYDSSKRIFQDMELDL